MENCDENTIIDYLMSKYQLNAILKYIGSKDILKELNHKGVLKIYVKNNIIFKRYCSEDEILKKWLNNDENFRKMLSTENYRAAIVLGEISRYHFEAISVGHIALSFRGDVMRPSSGASPGAR